MATLVFPGPPPLLAPLTAMLVVQVTPVSLLASGLDRVVAVVAGVALAVGFAAVAPLEWWSLGLLIFISLATGHLLRLGDNLLEVAISAMLVLGVGAFSAGSAAWQRIAETLWVRRWGSRPICCSRPRSRVRMPPRPSTAWRT